MLKSTRLAGIGALAVSSIQVLQLRTIIPASPPTCFLSFAIPAFDGRKVKHVCAPIRVLLLVAAGRCMVHPCVVTPLRHMLRIPAVSGLLLLPVSHAPRHRHSSLALDSHYKMLQDSFYNLRLPLNSTGFVALCPLCHLSLGNGNMTLCFWEPQATPASFVQSILRTIFPPI